MNQTNLDNITAILAAAGYIYNSASDGAFLALLWNQVENEIIHACNISRVSECDYPEMERITAFRLLAMKLKTGTLNGVDLDGIIKRVSEGDTTIEYSTGNTSALQTLSEYFDKQSMLSVELIASHRKVRW